MAEPVVIAPSGEVDIGAARELASRLNEAAGQLESPVVIDLTGVSFMDSTALGLVLQTDVRLRRNGRRLAVAAPSGSAAAVLIELSGLQRRLDVYTTREAAVEAAG
jgi:anti-anti-sigma factor